MWPSHSQIILFSGETSALAATASAVGFAARGQSTLLVSLVPTHPSATLLGVAPASEPTTLRTNLDFWACNTLNELNGIWNDLRARVQLPGPPVNGEDLPLLPGIDLFLAVYRLAIHARRNYALICVDAGPPDGLIRALAIPDTFRWLMRQLFGLDRGPGQSSESLVRAALPANLLPFEQIGRLQDARVTFEQLRDTALDPAHLRARLIIRPDQAGLRAATIAAPAFPLFGMNLDALIIGPLLPALGTNHGLESVIHEQEDILAAVKTRWPNLPLLRLPFGATPGAIDPVIDVGQDLMLSPVPQPPPITAGPADDPSLRLRLPGMARDDLSISVSGDELVVSLGAYRRHLLLPAGLRGVSIRAVREGDLLTIRRR